MNNILILKKHSKNFIIPTVIFYYWLFPDYTSIQELTANRSKQSLKYDNCKIIEELVIKY